MRNNHGFSNTMTRYYAIIHHLDTKRRIPHLMNHSADINWNSELKNQWHEVGVLKWRLLMEKQREQRPSYLPLTQHEWSKKHKWKRTVPMNTKNVGNSYVKIEQCQVKLHSYREKRLIIKANLYFILGKYEDNSVKVSFHI